MTAKNRSKLRDKVTVRLQDGPYIYAFGRMTANQAIAFKANPFQIFKGALNG